jgi:hypothetical protein
LLLARTISFPPINALVYHFISVTLTSSSVIFSIRSKYWFNEAINTSKALSTSGTKKCVALYSLINSLKLDIAKLLSSPPNIEVQ